MNSETPLDRIWGSYRITGDCLKITQRSVSKDEKSLLKGTAFINFSSKDESESWIEQSRTDVNDFVIRELTGINLPGVPNCKFGTPAMPNCKFGTPW